MRVQTWAPLMSAVLMFSVSAFADQGGNNNSNGNNSNSSLQVSIIGSMPNLTIGGISSAGASWTVSQSSVSIQPNGQNLWAIQVQVQNLLLASGTGVGTTGSVRAVAASVVCGGSGGAVVATTPGTAFDRSGAAQIQTTVNLPRSCWAPAVLVRVANPGTAAGAFIASTGLSLSSPNSPANSNNSDDDESN
jgi:hypothetical protein